MMLADQMSLFRCPESGSKLSLADADLIRRLNQETEAGRLRNRAGQIVDKPFDGGLVCAGGNLLYPVIDDIPVLLKNEAIVISSTS